MNYIKVICYYLLIVQVKWENRLKNSRIPGLHVSLDGTDFRVREPTPFSKKWYSHKFKAAGTRYELGLSVKESGFPCGEWPDIKIADELYCKKAAKELTLADKGYRRRNVFKNPSNAFEKRILARHETLNRRLKEFEILGGRFRNALKKHPMVFHVIVNVVQLSIANGESLFEL